MAIPYQKNKKIVSEYDQEIPQSQTADNPMAPRGRAKLYKIVFLTGGAATTLTSNSPTASPLRQNIFYTIRVFYVALFEIKQRIYSAGDK